jgi:prevent-host-death family protein
MNKASVTEAKNRLSALIDRVKAGSSVLIVERGRPVARLEPLTSIKGEQGGRLSRLLRDGLIRPRRGAAPRDVFTSRPPRVRGNASAVDLLLKEREEGR